MQNIEKSIYISRFRKNKEAALFLIMVGMFILMSILSPTTFLTWRNIQSMAYQLPEFGILSIAMMMVIVSGGINLSITFTAALSSIVGGLVLSKLAVSGAPTPITLIAGILTFLGIAISCGLINGFVVAEIGITPMLATLATSTLFEGICLNITRGGAISGFPDAFLWIGNSAVLGIPFPMIIFVLVIFASYLILERTSFGLKTYMIGCNPRVTFYSGVNVKRVLFGIYIFSAVLGALSGIIMASRYNSAKDSYGSSYLLQSVAASVLGGTDIVGGYGKIAGTVMAVMIIQIISSGLNIFGVNRFVINAIMGCILILVLAINTLSNGEKIAAGK
jgi:ribose/xylose/arabinose/galactoside ABC-type transport system permease subunit